MITNETQGIQISIESTNTLFESVELFQHGIAAFAGLKHCISFVNVKDTAAVNKSHFSSEHISIITRGGKASVTPEKFLDFITVAKPDLFHTLCDGETSENCANKRIYNAVTRTENFFRKCVERYKMSPILADSMLIGKLNKWKTQENR